MRVRRWLLHLLLRRLREEMPESMVPELALASAYASIAEYVAKHDRC
jgi:hypothetical protein